MAVGARNDHALGREVDKLGQAQAVEPATADHRATDPQIAWQPARFIEAVRSIPDNPVVLS